MTMDFRQLRVWGKAHDLTLEVYRRTTCFPAEERFGLTRQMRRSAFSIGSNLAEGCGRDTNADFRRFVLIAMGSASELEYQLLLAHDLGYLDSSAHRPMTTAVTEIKRMLTSFAQSLLTDN